MYYEAMDVLDKRREAKRSKESRERKHTRGGVAKTAKPAMAPVGAQEPIPVSKEDALAQTLLYNGAARDAVDAHNRANGMMSANDDDFIDRFIQKYGTVDNHDA